MNNNNPFGPPPNQQYFQPAQQPQQQPSAAQAFQQTMNAPPPAQTAQAALAGLNEAEIETRFPYFQPDVTFAGYIKAVRLVNGQQIGVGFFIEIDTVQASDDVLGMHAVKIDGFNNIKAKRFAMSDLKSFMLIALGVHNPKIQAMAAQRGVSVEQAVITADWKGDWIALAVQMCEQNLCEGTPIRGQTSLSAPSQANGKRKLKCLFAPAS